jgi:MoxR-like ATPase
MKNTQFLTTPAAQLPAQRLDPTGSWQQATHVWDAKELDALALAQASGRPLLIRGEPGTGKSQIARAASGLLGWDFDYEVITARHEAQDLLWHYDAVERLARANHGQPTHMQDFVRPGLLWRALNPASAARQQQRALVHAGAAEAGTPAAGTPAAAAPAPSGGTVVLLDEIDKADSDLPNSLLEVLANGGFPLPWGASLHAKGEPVAPHLIILTSNEERELPAAFVRRCICLHLVPPPDGAQQEFIAWLETRAAAHFPGIAPEILRRAAGLVYDDRLQAPAGMGARPGLAEYLDLLRALQQIEASDPVIQGAWLERLSPYALQKQYPHEQTRGLAHPDPRVTS